MLIKKALLSVVMCAVTLVALEYFLHFYHPLGFSLKGHRISLPTNTAVTYEVPPTEKLNSRVTVKKNSIGFRGTEAPARFNTVLSLVTVGGSTTESIMISEGQTWTDILGERLSSNFHNMWVNNAGFDGHSTFGHQILVDDYLRALRPKYVLFLVGANDLALFEGRNWDVFAPREEHTSILNTLAEHSELVALFQNIRRLRASQSLGLSSRTVVQFHSVIPSTEQYPDYRTLGVSTASSTLSEVVGDQTDLQEYLAAYRLRLEQLIFTVRQSDIEPILVTQPALYGPAIDDVTGVDLEKITVDTTNGEFGAGMSGKEKWELLESYNAVTRSVADEHNAPLIDLSHKLPKSSRYYYDFIHFSNEGSVRVASIIYEDLCSILWEAESSFRKTPCSH